MSSLDELIQQTAHEAEMAFVPRDTLNAIPMGLDTPEEAEAERMLRICNACRYCEGFCAVFPAMFRRLEFNVRDIHYLANLCHQCGACLHGCQHAPPMEFGINIPQAMQRVRVQTWSKFVWPRFFAALYRRNGLTVACALAVALALLVSLVMGTQGGLRAARGDNFYAFLSHGRMVAIFAPVFLWSALALGIGVIRFWRDGPRAGSVSDAVTQTAGDVLSLKYLGGGHGDGCNNEDDGFSLIKRRFHHAAFYGFLLCFAATCVATLYHYFGGISAPYAYTSTPKILGMLGGLLLVVGAGGLLCLNLSRCKIQGAVEYIGMDRGFIALLLLVGVSGLALTGMRGQTGMPIALAAHLGSVLAFFATMPYSKFAHGFYRCAALLKFNLEKRQPGKLSLAGD